MTKVLGFLVCFGVAQGQVYIDIRIVSMGGMKFPRDEYLLFKWTNSSGYSDDQLGSVVPVFILYDVMCR